MSTVSHGNYGMWRHPDDHAWNYTDLDYRVKLARVLDSGGFDTLFIADVVGQLDVYGGDAGFAQPTGLQGANSG
jgi:hypothetical protein